ncbi:tyrosine--tRNA ligase 1 cytoplasmic [Prunus yedoensis var. nudiflora]|uniref:tyrosine--tRNA ligase n=1 Tax=Prunus yedoensis var. nudiflora TaxID=2094558 RepID=A0A314YU90_PRUYE|nr:tyrosine--tRNA ligase 1 cytoplasmic [Prunus yedoensis var. nudiflora]
MLVLVFQQAHSLTAIKPWFSFIYCPIIDLWFQLTRASPPSRWSPISFNFRGFTIQLFKSNHPGVMKTINVNKMTSAGGRVKIWIADWFAMLNNKMGADLKKIETVGRYMIEIWRAAGMNLDNGKVEFLWSSKEINAKADEY